jgi:hypothetical protein
MLARMLSWLVLLARSDPAKDVEILVSPSGGGGSIESASAVLSTARDANWAPFALRRAVLAVAP